MPKIGKTIQVATLRATLIGDTKQFTQSMATAGGVGRQFANGIQCIGKVATTAFAIAGVAVAAYGAKAVSNAIKVESAFTGVTKTTDGLVDAQFEMTEMGQKVYDQFRDLAKVTPVAIEELMGIGEIAGQLGVPAEALVDFTDIIAKLGMTTNLTMEDGAKDLARFAAIYQVGAEDLADNTQRVGSTIVDLGNNFATTEQEIMKASLRLAGMSKFVNVSQQDVMGLSTALSALGVPTALGTTAMTKMFQTMQGATVGANQHIQTFAKTAGMSVDEFKKSFETDAMGAMQAFVGGLSDAGDNASVILQDLKLGGQRMGMTFLTLASNTDILEDALNTANQAWLDNNALQIEAMKRYETTAAQWEMLKNRVRDFSIVLGNMLLPFVNKVMKALGGVVMLLETGDFTTAIGEAFGGVAEDAPIVTMVLNLRNNFIHLKNVVSSFVQNDLPVLIEKFNILKEQIMTFLAPLIEFIKANTTTKDILIALGVAIASFVIPALASIIATIGGLVAIFAVVVAAIALFRNIWEENLFGIRDIVLSVVGAIREFWENNGESIVAFGKEMWIRIKEVFKSGIGAVKALVAFVVKVIKGYWERHGEEIKGLLKRSWDRIKAIFRGATKVIGHIFEAFRALFEGKWELFGYHLEQAWTNLWDVLGEALELAVDWLLTIILTLIDDIVLFFKDKDWGQIGKDIINGIIKGVEIAATKLYDTFKNIAQNALQKAKDILDIGSPSMAFAEQVGKPIMEGWALGMERMKGRPLEVLATTAGQATSMSREFNVNVNASYANQQSPGSVARDVETVARLLGLV